MCAQRSACAIALIRSGLGDMRMAVCAWIPRNFAAPACAPSANGADRSKCMGSCTKSCKPWISSARQLGRSRTLGCCSPSPCATALALTCQQH